MASEIEISLLDTRYEPLRMQDPKREGRLLSNIAQRGIEVPLQGSKSGQTHLLLNGFKRYRCARKLHITTVPFLSLSDDEVHGILELLRASHQHSSLHILEEARFVEALHSVHQMSVAEIAEELSRSKAWVSTRLGWLAKMSDTASKEIFAGRFPPYAYMVTLRPFMRLNGGDRNGLLIDQFVSSVSNHKLSIREIEQLAHGFFRGSDAFRREILKGNVALSLKQLEDIAPDPDSCSEFERLLLKDLELTHKYMQRVMGKCEDTRIKSRAFHAQSHLLTAGLLSLAEAFNQSMQTLHDRNGQA